MNMILHVHGSKRENPEKTNNLALGTPTLPHADTQDPPRDRSGNKPDLSRSWVVCNINMQSKLRHLWHQILCTEFHRNHYINKGTVTL